MTNSPQFPDRLTRMTPQVAEAMKLLAYAAQSGRPVDDDVRTALLQAADAAQEHTLTQGIEESFLKAYQQLTKAMDGVTVETLEASRTRMPRLGQLFSGDRDGFKDNLRHITGGRFVHCLLFLSVLFSAGYVLGQYTIGAMALDRYQTSTKCLKDARSAEASVQKLVAPDGPPAQSGTPATPAPVSQPDASDIAANRRATPACKPAQVLVEQYTNEQKSARDELQRWMQSPCSSRLTRWALCMLPDDQRAPNANIDPQALQLMAELRQKRTGEIEIPLLLGLLGAYSYVLRRMSLDIQNRTFAPGSSLHHVVRLSLGALAGLASGWLLQPESINLARSALSPYMAAWALAFVAGYSIELVFTLLDRLVSAFSSRST